MGDCKGFGECYMWVVAKGLESVTSGWLQRICRVLQVGGCKGFVEC